MLKDHKITLDQVADQARYDIEKAGYVPFAVRPTGSAHYGARNPNDFDVLVLLRDPAERLPSDENDGMPGRRPENLEAFIEQMKELGYVDCGELGNTSGGNSDEDEYSASWCALRADLRNGAFLEDSANLIVTTDPVWYFRQAAASELCRALGRERNEAPNKDTVVGIFRAVREAVNPFKPED